MSETAKPRRRLGCLPGLALLAVLGGAGVAALNLVNAPWIYVVGGRLRPLPVWQGTGVAEGPGGRYRLYVWFSPARAGTSVRPVTSIRGAGYLCTPRGERLAVRVGGGASGQVWRRMDGHEFHLYIQHQPSTRAAIDGVSSWPNLVLKGRWVGPDLALDDDAGLQRTFTRDGRLRPGPGPWTASLRPASIRLAETAWWPFGARCPQVRSAGP